MEEGHWRRCVLGLRLLQMRPLLVHAILFRCFSTIGAFQRLINFWLPQEQEKRRTKLLDLMKQIPLQQLMDVVPALRPLVQVPKELEVKQVGSGGHLCYAMFQES